MSDGTMRGTYLIYTEPLVSRIEDHLRDTDQQDEEERQWNIGYNASLYDAIRNICFTPAVDAVEVVRCGNCKYAMLLRKPEGKLIADCWIRNMNSEDEQFCMVSGDDFCSWGERRK